MSAALTTITADDLECPCCFNYLAEPIYMCRNRHSICAHCYPQLEKCPLCRDVYPTVALRNRPLEQRARQIAVPCTNAVHGCPTTLTTNAHRLHEQLCVYFLAQCPFPAYICRQHVPFCHLLHHCRTAHNCPTTVYGSTNDQFKFGCKSDYQSVVIVYENRLFLFLVEREQHRGLDNGTTRLGFTLSLYQMITHAYDDLDRAYICKTTASCWSAPKYLLPYNGKDHSNMRIVQQTDTFRAGFLADSTSRHAAQDGFKPAHFTISFKSFPNPSTS